MVQVVQPRLSRSAARTAPADDGAMLAAVVLTPAEAQRGPVSTIPGGYVTKRPLRVGEGYESLRRRGDEIGGPDRVGHSRSQHAD